MKTKIIEVKNLKKLINGQPILKNINLNVYQGEIYGLLGENGAGKTTTLRTIIGLLKKDSGKISIFGDKLSKKHFQYLGIMFEYESFNSAWSVIDNLKQHCYIYGVNENRIYELLELLNFPKKDISKKFRELSKGSKRKISFVSAILHNPKLLILDEPTTGLDPEMQIRIRNILLNFKSENKTILFSSHNLYEVQKMCDRVGIIKNGETIIELSINEPIYLIKGEYPELIENKVKYSDFYVINEETIKKFRR